MSSYLNVLLQLCQVNENYFPTLEINSEAFHSLTAIISRAVKIAAVERKPLA